MAIDTRHHDKNGEISRKHGNTFIHTLRKTYGPGFESWCADNAKLGDVLDKLDEPSLSHLIRDHEAGKLEQICQRAPTCRSAAGYAPERFLFATRAALVGLPEVRQFADRVRVIRCGRATAVDQLGLAHRHAVVPSASFSQAFAARVIRSFAGDRGRAAAPVSAMCCEFVAAGHDPRRPLHT